MEKAAIGIIASLPAITIAFIAMYFIYLLQKVFKLHDKPPDLQRTATVSAAGCHPTRRKRRLKTIGDRGPVMPGYAQTPLTARTSRCRYGRNRRVHRDRSGNAVGGWKIIETMACITTLHANPARRSTSAHHRDLRRYRRGWAPISDDPGRRQLGDRRWGPRAKVPTGKSSGEMVTAWVLTIPAAAGIAYGMFWLDTLPTAGPDRPVSARIAFGSCGLAMRNTIHASDIEAELPPRTRRVRPRPHPAPSGGPVD